MLCSVMAVLVVHFVSILFLLIGLGFGHFVLLLLYSLKLLVTLNPLYARVDVLRLNPFAALIVV